MDRDLSWLQFNERVLAEAQDESTPLLERVEFLAITASNLDEFFLFRYVEQTDPTRSLLLNRVREFVTTQDATLKNLIPLLTDQGIHLMQAAPEGTPGYARGLEFFRRRILPRLTSVGTFDPSLATEWKNFQKVALLQNGMVLRIPQELPPLAVIRSGSETWIHFLDDLLFAYLPTTGIAMESLWRVTRNGDFSMDLVSRKGRSPAEMILKRLEFRERGDPLRLERRGSSVHDRPICDFLGLRFDEVFSPGSLDLRGLRNLSRRWPGLSFPRHRGRVPPLFRRKDFFKVLDDRDVLLHHPYDAFDATVDLVRHAREDPQVVSIELTIYRMNRRCPLIDELKKAAKTKEVRVIIELRARLDEESNLALAEDLKSSGIDVRFGFGRWKLHAKLLLITRRSKEGKISRYCHLSTGNYNSTTASVYADLAIITSDAGIGKDARRFFDGVLNERIPSGLKELMMAPTTLHKEMVALIDHEIESARRGSPDARIVIKVNALTEESLVEKLYEASAAGVEIDLIVRGACAVLPGIPGISDRIRVISIVDRFLEHSRIYYFGHSDQLYLSSADWMPRNFMRRFEIAFPVKDPQVIRTILREIIPAYLNDREKARELMPDGHWEKRGSRAQADCAVRAQEFFRLSERKLLDPTP